MNHTMGQVDENLENIKNFTEPLGDNGPGIVNRMNDSVEKLNHLMSEMEVFSKAINSDQGSLGKLVNDDELYEHLNRTARNVEEISSRAAADRQRRADHLRQSRPTPRFHPPRRRQARHRHERTAAELEPVSDHLPAPSGSG